MRAPTPPGHELIRHVPGLPCHLCICGTYFQRNHRRSATPPNLPLSPEERPLTQPEEHPLTLSEQPEEQPLTQRRKMKMTKTILTTKLRPS